MFLACVYECVCPIKGEYSLNWELQFISSFHHDLRLKQDVTDIWSSAPSADRQSSTVIGAETSCKANLLNERPRASCSADTMVTVPLPLSTSFQPPCAHEHPGGCQCGGPPTRRTVAWRVHPQVPFACEGFTGSSAGLWGTAGMFDVVKEHSWHLYT